MEFLEFHFLRVFHLKYQAKYREADHLRYFCILSHMGLVNQSGIQRLLDLLE